MQEFAQKDSATPLGHCPSAEDLAAYIDGNLGKEESQRIIEHLASCEDCYAVYTETLHFQLDEEKEKLVPFPSRKEEGKGFPASVRQWFPIAALLLIGAGGGGGAYFQFLAAPPKLVTAKVTPPLPDPTKVEQPLWRGPTTRGGGGGDEEQAPVDEVSFRMGVQLVNLQASLKAGNVLDAEDAVARILGLLEPQSLTGDLQSGYKGVTGALENHQPPSKLLEEASRLAHVFREDFEPSVAFDFGQWVEAGRLAALAHNPSFFQQSDTQSFLRRLYWRDKLGLGDTKLDPVSRESLDQISEIASKSALQAPDYAELQRQFDKILEIYYPET